MKEAVTGSDNKTIVAEVERGEDYLKAKFEAALTNAELSPIARETVEGVWTSIREGHDEMRELRNRMTDYPTD